MLKALEDDVTGKINNMGADLYGDGRVFAIGLEYFPQITSKNRDPLGVQITETFGNFMKQHKNVSELLLINMTKDEITTIENKNGNMVIKKRRYHDFSDEFPEHTQRILETMEYGKSMFSDHYA